MPGKTTARVKFCRTIFSVVVLANLLFRLAKGYLQRIIMANVAKTGGLLPLLQVRSVVRPDSGSGWAAANQESERIFDLLSAGIRRFRKPIKKQSSEA
jgi:hypothetical protein